VWRISMLQPADRTENCGYPTQKPEALLQRIVQAASSEGDLVADFFCGSGTMLAVAEKLNRRWIGCDLGRWGIHATRKRLLGVKHCRPFVLLDLGQDERRYWRDATFCDGQWEYIAFMLKLYGAEPIEGFAHSQGRKQDALVHVGPVDAPVTTQQIDAAVDECAMLHQQALHVLGWSWQGERCDVMARVAATKGVKLLLRQIPREVMEQQAAGILFSPLACFDAAIEQPGSLTAQVMLRNFVIPNAELLPPDEHSKVEKWPDYIDYWAVDWDGCDETIAQGWAAYRTRKQKDLSLVSDLHRYEKAGKHRILVQVIDIFGNATRQAFDVDIQQP